MGLERSTWARRLRVETDDFSRHLYMPGFWDDPHTLQEMVSGMFSKFRSDPDPPVLRVYVSKGQRFDLEARLVSAEFDGRVSLEHGIGRVIKHKKFCVTLNGLTKWNNKFHLLLHKSFVTPLLKETGAPLGGLDSYAFIGNYGFTPFGIHDDGELSFLLHLGAEEKSVYLWPHELFLKIRRDPTSNFNFKGLERWAVRYILRPGDLLFIPKGVYHVLNSRGFSVTLGFTVFPSTRTGEIMESVKLLYERLPARERFFAGQTNWETTLRKPKLQLSVDGLSHQLWRYRMSLKSNGYMTTSPREANLNHSDLGLSHDHFQVPRQFKIYSGETGNVLEIFVRGRALQLTNTRRLRQLVQFLNLRKPFKYAHFVRVLEDEWTKPAIRQLFNELYNVRAFFPVHDLHI